MTVISAAAFGAVGDGSTDDTEALQNAFNAAAATGASVYIPPGVYNHSGTLTINGITVAGAGASTVLRATNAETSAVILTGTNPSLSSIETTVTATYRWGSVQQAAIAAADATNFTIADDTVLGSAGVGIEAIGSSHGTIANNSVMDSQADGITMINDAPGQGAASNGNVSSYINVTGNLIERAGDDSISVVTYTGAGSTDANNNIAISGNTVLEQRNGRGVALVGGHDVTISGNYIDTGTSESAGIVLLADSGFGTYGVWNSTVSGNTIKGENPAGGVFIDDGYGPGAPANEQIYGNTISDNSIYAPQWDPIVLVGGSNNHDMTIAGNTAYGGGSGLAYEVVDPEAGISATGNQSLGLTSYPGDAVSESVGSGSGAPLPVATPHVIQIVVSGDADAGQNPMLWVTANGEALSSQIQVTASHSPATWQTITLKPFIVSASFLTFELVNDPSDPTPGFAAGTGNMAIYIQSVLVDGVAATSSQIDLTNATSARVTLPTPIISPPVPPVPVSTPTPPAPVTIAIPATEVIVTVPANSEIINALSGNHIFLISGHADTFKFGGGTEIVTDSGTGGNTFNLPAAGTGSVSFNAAAFADGDVFNLTAALAGTQWDGSAGTLASYLHVTQRGGATRLLVSQTASSSAAETLLARFDNQTLSLSSILGHSIT